MTKMEIGICARLMVYEMMLETLLAGLMIGDPNQAKGFEMFRTDIMDAVRYGMISEGDQPDSLAIQTEAITVAEDMLRHVASKVVESAKKTALESS